MLFFFFQAEDGIRDSSVTGVQTCALPIFLERRLHTDDDRLLPDIEVAEAADQSHAVHLSGSFFEAPDRQHVTVITEQLFRRDTQIGELDRIGFALDCHNRSLRTAQKARPRDLARSMGTNPRRCTLGRSKSLRANSYRGRAGASALLLQP